MRFSRVKLDSLEARLRPVEQLDKWTPRGTSSLGAGHHGGASDYIKVFKSVISIYIPSTLRLNLHPCKLPCEITQTIGAHTCEGRSKAAVARRPLCRQGMSWAHWNKNVRKITALLFTVKIVV
jgi:hypothetical protein